MIRPASFVVVLCTSIVTAGCCPGKDATRASALTLQRCSTLNGYTAALAEATIACTGTIGPDSFNADSGWLVRTFNQCDPTPPPTFPPAGRPQTPEENQKSRLKDVDDLLFLQRLATDQPYRECFVDPWKRWQKQILASGYLECPTWKKVEAFNHPTRENILTLAATQPRLPKLSDFSGGKPIKAPPSFEEFKRLEEFTTSDGFKKLPDATRAVALKRFEELKAFEAANRIEEANQIPQERREKELALLDEVRQLEHIRRLSDPTYRPDKIRFGKEGYYYAVSFTNPRAREAARPAPAAKSSDALAGGLLPEQVAAVQCAGGLPGFYPTPGPRGTVYADGYLWEDPTDYAPGKNPFVPPYRHAMSYVGDVPGVRSAHRNRAGELCSYYDGEDHVTGILVVSRCWEWSQPETCWSVCTLQ
jgi:hypothetical protein